MSKVVFKGLPMNRLGGRSLHKTSPPLAGVCGRECRQKLENAAWGRPEHSENSPKVSGTVQEVSGECLGSVFGLSPGLLEAFRGRHSRDMIFETFSGLCRTGTKPAQNGHEGYSPCNCVGQLQNRKTQQPRT